MSLYPQTHVEFLRWAQKLSEKLSSDTQGQVRIGKNKLAAAMAATLPSVGVGFSINTLKAALETTTAPEQARRVVALYDDPEALALSLTHETLMLLSDTQLLTMMMDGDLFAAPSGLFPIMKILDSVFPESLTVSDADHFVRFYHACTRPSYVKHGKNNMLIQALHQYVLLGVLKPYLIDWRNYMQHHSVIDKRAPKNVSIFGVLKDKASLHNYQACVRDDQNKIEKVLAADLQPSTESVITFNESKILKNESDTDESMDTCPHCGSDLTAENSVVRDYLNKDSTDEESGFDDVSAYGHYTGGCFKSDSFSGFGDGRYDLADDSDKCHSCDGPL
jgi:hypothetical protein